MPLTHAQKYRALVRFYERAIGRRATPQERASLKQAHDDSAQGSMMAGLALGDYVSPDLNREWPGPMRAAARESYRLAHPQPREDQDYAAIMESGR